MHLRTTARLVRCAITLDPGGFRGCFPEVMSVGSPDGSVIASTTEVVLPVPVGVYNQSMDALAPDRVAQRSQPRELTGQFDAPRTQVSRAHLAR